MSEPETSGVGRSGPLPYRGSVLVVDCDPKVCRNLQATLEAEGLHTASATSPVQAHELALMQSFDLVLLDLAAAERSSEDLIDLIGRRSPGCRVIATTARLSRDVAREMVERRVHDLLLKPFDLGQLRKTVAQALREKQLEMENRRYMDLLEAKNRELQALNERLKQLVVTDSLTGLHNHGYCIDALQREIGRARRYRLPLSLTFLDIDHFKEFNDSHGHLEGDGLLRQLAELMTANLRREDIVCRYGGEEFTLIQPVTARSEAILVAQRLLRMIEHHSFRTSDGLTRHITVSAGLASLDEEIATPVDLIRAADNALYRSKATGRNRLMVHQGGQIIEPAGALPD